MNTASKPPTNAGDDPLADVSRVRISVGDLKLEGELTLPPDASGIIVFAHGSGSGRHSPRNQAVARALQSSGFATLLFDLLSDEEERQDGPEGLLRFDIALLTSRLVQVVRWVSRHSRTHPLVIGLFGSSTGAAAALGAAAELGQLVAAVVSRGGRPDLAEHALPRVVSPTLLIVGDQDETVVELNREAYALLRCQKQLALVPGATHLFEEPGALEHVSTLAAAWFQHHLTTR